MNLIKTKASTWNAEDTILVDTIADLQGVLKLSGVVFVKGHTTVGDGGGGKFFFDASVLRSTDDNGTIIAPVIGDGLTNGCWLRSFNLQEYSLAFFGSDDTAKANLQAAYGTENAIVSIIELNTLTTYKFNAAKVADHDGASNYYGWVKQGISGAGALIWKDSYVGGAYSKDDVVRDGEWTMVANQDTTERPAPQNVGAAYYKYVDGSEASANVTAKQVVYGTRITATTRGYLNGYRMKVTNGQNYSVFTVEDPLVTPKVTELQTFVADSTGWVYFNITPVLISENDVFDLCVRTSVPDGAPTVNATQYDYSTPQASTIPGLGDMTHAIDDPSVIKVNNQGSDATDNSAVWTALSVGDIISGAGGEWVVQYKVNNTTYWDIHVEPASVGSPATATTMNVNTVAAAATYFDREVDGWLADSSATGLFIQDGGYNAIVVDDNAYMIDLKIQDASISTHWDILAVSEAASANDAGGFVAHVFDSHSDTNFPTPADGAVVTWDNGTSKWIAGTSLTTHLALTNEHLDWTVDQGATNIHENNIPHTHSEYALLAGGTVFTGQVSATKFVVTSDVELKNVLGNFNAYRSEVATVPAEWYDLKDGTFSNQLGYMAHKVERELPAAVSINEKTGFKSVDYSMVHTAKIAKLEKQVEELSVMLNKALGA